MAVTIPLDHFWSNVGGSATNELHHTGRFHLSGQTEISKFDLRQSIWAALHRKDQLGVCCGTYFEQNILGLEVPVDNVELTVQVIQSP